MRNIIPFAPLLLPDIATVRLKAKALAMLEAIVSPDWEYRYYSFDAHWGDGEEMASMRNGSGDDCFLLFGSFGAAIKGFAHDASDACNNDLAAAVRIQLPQAFASFLNEPAFSMHSVSYCYWSRTEDPGWHKVACANCVSTGVDDGSSKLAVLCEPAASYVAFANEYYEIELPLSSVQRIYEHGLLTEELVKALNPGLDFAEARKFAAEIGYPCV
ncbi:hypothetical protein [Pseudomonas sp. Irchel 3A5]|uniref:hypothetical protein n=1 Tax=Pseudomonas sp. Irchel 3A5 TaxID=2008911 RepID=UPI000BA4591A|nr:hypothetical protein [Pseudomonas sp. Irchel 3A5]